MKITLIRHAQAEHNVNNELHKSNNTSLTEAGIKSCKSLDFSFDLLILSPLKRVIQTYANSNIKTKNIMVSDLFQEFKNNPCNLMDKMESDKTFETIEEFENRISKAISFLKELKYNNIGIITHHDFIHKFTKKLTSKPISLLNIAHHEINLNK